MIDLAIKLAGALALLAVVGWVCWRIFCWLFVLILSLPGESSGKAGRGVSRGRGSLSEKK